MIDTYVDMFDLCYFEVQEAFRELADENVWKRPAEGLLSIGEIAGHIAYSEARRLASDDDSEAEKEVATWAVHSPLIDRRFAYYPITLQNPPSEEQSKMTAEQVCQELVRVHEEAIAAFKKRAPDLDSAVSANEPRYTYREALKYLIFHISYHTGQIYSARHLLGEQTPDN